MAKGNTNPDFLNGVPELAVLRVLFDGPQHGYAIVQSISKRTGGTLQFGEGSIYPILHKLEQQGLLMTRREVAGGRERIVYRLSKRGSKQLEESCHRWQNVVQSVQALIEGGDNGLSPVVPAAS
ncbi:MAG: helix-turn-helix transcriptional regulator [Pirellulaceae bacterium]|nr:helix-turn-helix transcriptional regulator [Pirellulaceae bacterium]